MVVGGTFAAFEMRHSHRARQCNIPQIIPDDRTGKNGWVQALVPAPVLAPPEPHRKTLGRHQAQMVLCGRRLSGGGNQIMWLIIQVTINDYPTPTSALDFPSHKGHIPNRKAGGRMFRQSGQGRKAATVTNFIRVARLPPFSNHFCFIRPAADKTSACI